MLRSLLGKESSLLIVKNEPNIDYIAYSGDNNSKITDDLKFNESEIKLENGNEILHIKQEELNIKDEIQMADEMDEDIESALFTHIIHKFTTKPKQELHQPKKLFACTLCEFKAVSRSQLNSHTRIHPETIVNCNLCEYKTTDKYALARHIKTHTGEKPFACSVCKFKTSQKYRLKIHEKVHTKEKLYACSICELKYFHKGHLKKHILTHTQEKSFVCSICEFTSSQKRSLITHQRIHRVKKPLAHILPRMSVYSYFRK